MRITTEHPGVALRPWTVDDVPAMERNGNNRAVWRNLTDLSPPPYPQSVLEAWIATVTTPSRSAYMVIEADGEFAGAIAVEALAGLGCCTGNFGYWLGQDYWGRGIASAAARAMVKFATGHLSFVRLEAPVFAWNPASMRVLEKSGFVREGILRRSIFKDGEITDAVMYAHLIGA